MISNEFGYLLGVRIVWIYVSLHGAREVSFDQFEIGSAMQLWIYVRGRGIIYD